jgi:uncharacterized protein (TIGR00730 family)
MIHATIALYMFNFMASKKNTFNGQTCRIPLPPAETEKIKHPPKMSDISWRIFRIMAEFVEGFQFLSESEREVTIFGSARTSPDNKWYKEARKLGQLLAENNFTVTTGGGPGIMEAANRGAFDKDGESLGLNIQLPAEQRINPYVKKSHAFHYFFTRKVILSASAQAYVYFPGGYGTMDELFEIMTLIQTGKMQNIPVVLVGKVYWEPLIDWINNTFVKEFKTIAPEDVGIFTVVDTAEEAFDLIKDSEERTFF